MQPRKPHDLSKKEFGLWGEDVAADYLERKGYRILERDWHSGHRDIDIIARNADSVVFVEVKTRRSRDFGEPFEAVNYQKRRNLLTAISHYIRYKHLELRPRFDIISIVANDLFQPEIQHFEDIQLA
ncbi:MAG: YraN family protein [Bacteroidaceae bacterium]|nr:YraN family protein [Bacteroidaceae bacterium]